jgi:hypothetical protein
MLFFGINILKVQVSTEVITKNNAMFSLDFTNV